MIILDFGGGDNCKNDRAIIKDMIDSIVDISMDEDIIIKWQLFNNIKYLEALKWDNFTYAYYYARDRNIETTASVFGLDTLNFLSAFDVPFIKIACRDSLYQLSNLAPSETGLLVSVDSIQKRNQLQRTLNRPDITYMYCVAEYPANSTVYETSFGGNLSYSISDHTEGTYLYEKYSPKIWEKHFILEHGMTDDPYGDDFCITPGELKALLK